MSTHHAEPLARMPTSSELLAVLNEAVQQLEATRQQKIEPIAVIGIGCRFPRTVSEPSAFWRQLRDGTDVLGEAPGDRWDCDAYYDANPEAAGKVRTRHGAYLGCVDEFDAQFFGITPREARAMDPQQRLLLEVAWEALEHAGVAADRLAGCPAGVFVGVGQFDYARGCLHRDDASKIDAYDGTGNLLSFAAGRVSYLLGLQGPSLVVDTACSSSLVAVHLACQSLRAKECELALAAGVHLVLGPEVTLFLSRAGALAPDGRCKTFDAAADGYGRGEGCGVVVLKRLSDAAAVGDTILAVLRGSAINHDGASSGFTVPNGRAQEAVIREALANADVASRQVQYVEAHGTGTALGDPMEVHALAAALATGRDRRDPLLIGSVKSQIGHLEAAAGIAGLIKVVLALQHEMLPAQTNFRQPSWQIDWDRIAVRVVSEPTPWPATAGPRIAGVSSFGMSGTNAHVLVAEAPVRPRREVAETRPAHLLMLSAKTESALRELARRYADHVGRQPDLDLGDLCFTANTGRASFACRLALVASTSEQLRDQLYGINATVGGVRRSERAAQRPALVFRFAPRHGQFPQLVQTLYTTYSEFRGVIDRASAILSACGYPGLTQALMADPEVRVDELDFELAGPAGFALNYAWARLWRSWGIAPDGVCGEGMGAHAAACVAGCFEFAEGLRGIVQLTRGAISRLSDTVSMRAPDRRIVAGDDDQPVSRGEILEAKGESELWLEVGSCPRIQRNETEWLLVLRALAALYQHGFDVDWVSLDRGQPRLKVVLPTYPFQRQRFWINHPSLDRRAEAKRGRDSQSPLIQALQDGDLARIEAETGIAGGLSTKDREQLASLLSKWSGYTPTDSATANDVFYEETWVLQPRAKHNGHDFSKSGYWLVFADAAGSGRRLAGHLAARGAACRLVYAATSSPQDNSPLVVDTSDPQDFRRLFSKLSWPDAGRLRGIVYLWGLDIPSAATAPEGELEQAAQSGCEGLVYLAQVMAEAKLPATPLWVVTRGAVPAGPGGDCPSIFQAPLWGLTKSIVAEYPGYRGGLLDLDPASPDGVEELIPELLGHEGEEQVAIRRGQRYVARLSRATISKWGSTFACRPDASYLITGGTGALGVQVAVWMAGLGARRLVLLGRRGVVPEPAERVLDRLRNDGVEIEIVRADVTYQAEMRPVLSAMARGGRLLRGIVHAAGIRGHAKLSELDAEALREVLRPKVTGTWSLHRLTESLHLDFFVCFSSIASVWGAAGQAHYAAANRFLDACAHYRRARGLPALTVNWGPWCGGGMATEAFARLMRELGIDRIEPRWGVVALNRLMSSGVPQALVARVDWSKFAAIYQARGERKFLAKVIPAAAANAPYAQPVSSMVLDQLRGALPVERMALLKAHLRKELAEIMGLSPRAFGNTETGFFEMGMDSMMAVELKNRLERGLRLSFPATLAFDFPTVEVLAAHILRTAGLSPRRPARPAEGHARLDERSVAGDVQDTPHPKVESLIEQELKALEELMEARLEP